MDDAKDKIVRGLIYLYLIIFPFGQILRFKLSFFGQNLNLVVIDIIALILLFLFIFSRKNLKNILKTDYGLLLVLLFSFIVNIPYWGIKSSIPGFFYLIRLISYFAMFYFVKNIFKSKKDKKFILNALIGVTFFSAVFGWIQYFVYPDLRPLQYLDWDDHLFRLVGSFLDPGFTGLFFTFGFLLSFNEYFKKRDKKYLIISLFLAISTAFTYSRASILALMLGFSVILILNKRIKVMILTVIAFVLLLVLLPRPGGMGVRLERLYSIFLRIRNYEETIHIFNKRPVFGVGYNNLCVSRLKFLPHAETGAHSCSGSDSSLLLILATTGVVGALSFLGYIYRFVKGIIVSKHNIAILSILTSLFIHSLFVNSLFYTFTMGFLAILTPVYIKKKN